MYVIEQVVIELSDMMLAGIENQKAMIGSSAIQEIIEEALVDKLEADEIAANKESSKADSKSNDEVS